MCAHTHGLASLTCARLPPSLPPSLRRHRNGAPLIELYGPRPGTGPERVSQRSLTPLASLSLESNLADDLEQHIASCVQGQGSGVQGLDSGKVGVRVEGLEGMPCGLAGSICSFNVKAPDGSYVRYSEVEMLAALEGIN
eukprot:3219749-Rhodomonas_salina.1